MILRLVSSQQWRVLDKDDPWIEEIKQDTSGEFARFWSMELQMAIDLDTVTLSDNTDRSGIRNMWHDWPRLYVVVNGVSGWYERGHIYRYINWLSEKHTPTQTHTNIYKHTRTYLDTQRQREGYAHTLTHTHICIQEDILTGRQTDRQSKGERW